MPTADVIAASADAWAGRAPPPDLAAPLTARILIVDDDPHNAQAAVDALAALGHELVVAHSGEEALERLADQDYALILLDVHMPGLDGYRTAGLIRARPRTARTPIIFVTAIFRDEAHIFQAYTAGAVDVVFKPVDPFILTAKARVFLDLHLKTEEARRQSAYRQWLLDEHAQVKAEKAQAERALRTNEARQEVILKALPIAFLSRPCAPPFAMSFVSDSIAQITGFPPSRFTDGSDFGMSRIHPDDLGGAIEGIAAAGQAGRYSVEFRWRCADGRYRVFHDQGVVAPGEEGEARELFGVILDVTDRRSLEEQLVQARKMEAVGRLTGGVAHDFNNLLTVVLGNVEMLTARDEPAERRTRRIEAVRQAAERGRDLTAQLLAFARRQNLTPVTLDVNALIRDFAPLMEQAVGEAVTLELALADEPLKAHVDPIQLETALLNLAVNARDAMPGGGRLRVVTRRETDPARHVAIEVRDNGVGMSEDVRARAFEPFFTTKEVGRGSGLGLSQVYGFVSQSEGQVRLESAPGEGTAFHLLLPFSRARVERRRRDAPTTEGLVAGGREKILLVEDDPTVLAVALDVLTGLGYRVVTAANAVQALETLRAERDVDLLFTDVVMPGGVSGLGLARAARELRPGLHVLLTSGFVGDERAADRREFPLLDKPYEAGVLAAALRRLLDPEGRRRRGRSARAAAAPPSPHIVLNCAKSLTPNRFRERDG